MISPLHLSATIPEELAGKRLDQALAEMFPEHSRSRLQTWIKSGELQVNSRPASQRQKVSGGESIILHTIYSPQQDWDAENIPLDILFEDEYLLVVNKPAGLVVHPGAGNPAHTLLNALLHHDPQLVIVPRAGIVHRLDKGTSGVMLVARKPEVHTFLVAELQKRAIKREYEAIVNGVMTAGGTIHLPVGRHPVKRTRMAVVKNGKEAVTHYRIIRKFRAHTHIRVFLETGRTHQIRVHLSHQHYPIVGDPDYNKRASIPRGCGDELKLGLQTFPRQALHAISIQCKHPQTGKPMTCETELPDDMQTLLGLLEDDEA